MDRDIGKLAERDDLKALTALPGIGRGIAMYSNTARAHELKRTHDWVVIFFYDNHHQQGQHTVVTETRGPLIGQRVVRGMETACRDYYSRAG